MKALPASLRERKRYIFFDVEAEDDFSKNELSNAIWREALSLFGDSGTSDLGITLLEFDGTLGLLKCNHKGVDKARAALASLRDVKGTRAAIRVDGVSGTIRTGIEKFKREKNIGRAINSIPSRVELKYVSGKVKRIRGEEVDIVPDEDKNEMIKRSDVSIIGITVSDLKLN